MISTACSAFLGACQAGLESSEVVGRLQALTKDAGEDTLPLRHAIREITWVAIHNDADAAGGEHWVTASAGESMSANVLDRSLLVGTLILGASFTLGCATVVVPLKPGAAAIEDSDHGLVFGRIHVTGNRSDQRFDVEWLLTEESRGAWVRIDALPTDGPFAVQLPAGSYRLTEVDLDMSLGVWQASLPATFTVRSRECTYLGTWELDLQAEFFSGLITRQVYDQQMRDEDDLRRIIGASPCPVLKVPLASSMKSSAVLTDQAESTELTSPP